MEWTTACPDWAERIVARRSLVPFPPLFPEEARAARGVLQDLRLVDVAGSPSVGSASRPWVLEFCDAIFGAYDQETGRRLIREFFLLVSKKNGKSTIAAAIMLTALIRNWRLSGEFLILAPTIEIANNSFLPARDMIRHDEDLTALFHVQDHYRTITHRGTGATLKVVAADNETVGGKKAIGVLVDELWQFGSQANAENMLREATGGLASRPEGFVIYISTQSDQPPAGVFKKRLHYARAVRDGRVEDKRFLPVIYEFPDRMLKAEQGEQPAYEDKGNFYITNPNLGASVDVEFIEREFDKGREDGPESLVGFFAKHLNIEIGLNLRSDRWPGADQWKGAADDSVTFDALIARCEVIVFGADGGGLDDLYGLAAMGRERGTRKRLLWTHAWANRKELSERRKALMPRLEDFAKAGDLTFTGRIGQDVIEIADYIERAYLSGLLPSKHGVGLDPVGVKALVDELAERGIEGDIIVGVTQGWKLAGAIKGMERDLAGGKIVHADQEMMDWCVGNAKVEPRGNAIMITKQAAGTAKIDPLMAAFDAQALMDDNPEARGQSVFEADARAREEAQKAGKEATAAGNDPMAGFTAEEISIIENPRHPRWREVRDRFEQAVARRAGDDDQEF